MNPLQIPRIEHCGNAVWAVITQDGVAVFSDSESAVAALRDGDVVESTEDWAWYDAHGPWHFCPDLTSRAIAART